MDIIGGYYYNQFPKKDIDPLIFINNDNTIDKNLFYPILMEGIDVNIDNIYKYYNPFDSDWIKKYTLIDHNNVIMYMPIKSSGIIMISKTLEMIDFTNQYKQYQIANLDDPSNKYTNENYDKHFNINKRIIKTDLHGKYIYDDISKDGVLIGLIETTNSYNNFHNIQRKITEPLLLRLMSENSLIDESYLNSLRKFVSNNLKYLMGKFFGINDDPTTNDNAIMLMYDTGLLVKFYQIIGDPDIKLLSKIPQNTFDMIVAKVKKINYASEVTSVRNELFNIFSTSFGKKDYFPIINTLINNFTDDDFILIANSISIQKMKKKIITMKKNSNYRMITNFINNSVKYYQNILTNLERYHQLCNIMKYSLFYSENKISSSDIAIIKTYLSDKAKIILPRLDKTKIILPQSAIKTFIHRLNKIENIVNTKEFANLLLDFVINDFNKENNFDKNYMKDNIVEKSFSLIEEYINNEDHKEENYHKKYDNFYMERINDLNVDVILGSTRNLIHDLQTILENENLISKITETYCEHNCCLKYSKFLNETRKKKDVNYKIYLCEKIIDVLLELNLISKDSVITMNAIREENVDYVIKESKNTNDASKKKNLVIQNYLSQKIDKINQDILNTNPTKIIAEFISEIMRIIYNVIHANNSFDLDVGTGVVGFYVSKLLDNPPKYVSRATFCDTFNILNISPSDFLFNNIKKISPFLLRNEYYDFVKIDKINSISDCVESSLRNLINLIILDESGNIDITKLPKNTYSGLKEYYQKYNKIEDHYSHISSEDWANMLMIARKKLFEEKGEIKNFVNKRDGFFCDIKSNYINFIKIVSFLLGENTEPYTVESNYYVDFLKKKLEKYFDSVEILFNGDDMRVIIDGKYKLNVNVGHSFFEYLVSYPDKKSVIDNIVNVINANTDKLITDLYFNAWSDIYILSKNVNYFIMMMYFNGNKFPKNLFSQYLKINNDEIIKRISSRNIEEIFLNYLEKFEDAYWWYDIIKYKNVPETKCDILLEDKINAVAIIELTLFLLQKHPRIRFSLFSIPYSKHTLRSYHNIKKIINELSSYNLEKYIEQSVYNNYDFEHLCLIFSDTKNYISSIDILVNSAEKYNKPHSFDIIPLIFRNNITIITNNPDESYYYLLKKIRNSSYLINKAYYVVNRPYYYKYEEFGNIIESIEELEKIEKLKTQYITADMIVPVNRLLHLYNTTYNNNEIGISNLVKGKKNLYVPTAILRILYILYGYQYNFRFLIECYNITQQKMLDKNNTTIFFPEIELNYPNIIENILPHDEQYIDIVSENILHEYHNIYDMIERYNNAYYINIIKSENISPSDKLSVDELIDSFKIDKMRGEIIYRYYTGDVSREDKLFSPKLGNMSDGYYIDTIKSLEIKDSDFDNLFKIINLFEISDNRKYNIYKLYTGRNYENDFDSRLIKGGNWNNYYKYKHHKYLHKISTIKTY